MLSPPSDNRILGEVKRHLCGIQQLLSDMKYRSRLLIYLITIATVFAGLACPARDVIIETVAGTGSSEHNGDSGHVSAVNVGNPFGVVIGPDGALYITEIQNHRVLRVDLNTGGVSTVAGCGRK